MRADLFCRVIDNYGDIGVVWRLARRLAQGHGWQVRLWVDDLASFARIAPAVDAAREAQTLALGSAKIAVRRWAASGAQASGSDIEPGEVLIEAFGCDPPPDFIARLRADQTVWINLEYLSAEAWVESCHGLPSPQAGGLTKYFFFPGFTAKTGGLLREPGLLAAREAWRAEAGAQRSFLARLGVPAEARAALDAGARLCTAFCYPHAPIAALCAALSQSGPAVLLVPQGVLPNLAAGRHGQVQVVRIPFVPQTEFDQLLWCADLNLVRGEDSLVRALWAGRPLLWHIYPQENAAHLDKLRAWLECYQPPACVQALSLAWNSLAWDEGLAWNEVQPDAAQSALQNALREPWNAALTGPQWQAWREHAEHWSRRAACTPDLADQLVDFCLQKRQGAS